MVRQVPNVALRERMCVDWRRRSNRRSREPFPRAGENASGEEEAQRQGSEGEEEANRQGSEAEEEAHRQGGEEEEEANRQGSECRASQGRAARNGREARQGREARKRQAGA